MSIVELPLEPSAINRRRPSPSPSPSLSPSPSPSPSVAVAVAVAIVAPIIIAIIVTYHRHGRRHGHHRDRRHHHCREVRSSSGDRHHRYPICPEWNVHRTCRRPPRVPELSALSRFVSISLNGFAWAFPAVLARTSATAVQARSWREAGKKRVVSVEFVMAVLFLCAEMARHCADEPYLPLENDCRPVARMNIR